MLSDSLQSCTNLQHKFLHMGSTVGNCPTRWSLLLAPTGALVVMMVYYISIRPLFQIFTQSIDAIDVYKCHSKGRYKKNIFFVFGKTPRGEVSQNPKFPYQKKIRFFWIFFSSKGGGSYLLQKGVIIKRWGFWDIFAKRGGFTQFIGILS